MDYSASALLASIRRRASIPTTTVNGSTDADLLRLANEELRLGMVSDIMAVREEFFVRDFDHTITTTIDSYRIPPRAIGGKLRSVRLVDSAGNETAPLPRIDPENAQTYGDTGQTMAYCLKGNSVVLLPSANTTCPTLRLSYFIRPNEVVASGTQNVTIIAGTTLTVASAAAFSTSTYCDLVAGTPNYEFLGVSMLPTGTTGTTVTFASLPLTIGELSGAGVILCLAEQTPVVQLPTEFFPVLCQRVAVTYLEASGQLQELAEARKKLEAMEKQVMVLISPRDDAGSRKSVCTDFIGPALSSTRFRSGD